MRCERVGAEWLLLEDDLHLAAEMTDVATGAAGPAMLSIAFPDEQNGRRALERLRRRFALRAGNLGIAPLALDGADLVLVAGVFPAEALDDVLEIAAALGGVVVDGVAESRISGERWRPGDEEQGQSSYG